MNFQLANKTIVISGGTKGVGKQLAIELVSLGANVVIGGRDFKNIEDFLTSSNKITKRVLFVHTDLGNILDINNLFATAFNEFKRIDGFVNYAGITPISSLSDCSEDVYDSIMSINLKAAFFCVQESIKYMRLNRGGTIVLVGSAHAWSGEKDRAAYAISKGALLTLSEHIAHNYASENIRSNYITMGWTATEGELNFRSEHGVSFEQLSNQAAAILPMGRLVSYNDLLPSFLYFLSDVSSMVTGSNIRVTAGQYI